MIQKIIPRQSNQKVPRTFKSTFSFQTIKNRRVLVHILYLITSLGKKSCEAPKFFVYRVEEGTGTPLETVVRI